MTTLSSWLGSLGPDRLADLLVRRPDAQLAPQPRTLTELAARLSRPSSIGSALRELPRPAVQLCEALVALGPGPSRAAVGTLIAGSSPYPGTSTSDTSTSNTSASGTSTSTSDTSTSDASTSATSASAAIDTWLGVLADHGIVWPGTGPTVQYPEGLAALFPDALGLGTPVQLLLDGVTVARLRPMLSALGVTRPPSRRDELIADLTRVLTDPDQVRRIVDDAPPAVAQELRAWALAPEDGSYDPMAVRRRRVAETWAAERGLAFSREWSYGFQMPAEVTLALRGPGYRAPFDAAMPPVTATTVDGAGVTRQASAAAGHFSELALALVDRVARRPVAALKAGGVGAREITRLAKELGCQDRDARLVLELCAMAGIIGPSLQGWALGERAQAWRESEPADRTSTLIQGWWRLGWAPTESRDSDDKFIPALATRPCDSCRRARRNIVAVLAGIGEDATADRSELAARALWRRPFVHVLAQDSIPFATHLDEATTLGVVADGACSPFGAALLRGDAEQLHSLLRAALPAANDTALFGPDLTAVVSGAPTAAVSRLLDAAGDREGRGGATVWRFSPGSVRRALDEGYDADTLTAELAAIAAGELPQPLAYLIADIGRRHGNLRVAAARSTIRGLDEALTSQVAADRALRKLGLRVLGPTVLGADADVDEVLAALRGAGYLPMPEDVDIPATPTRPDGAGETEADGLLRAVRALSPPRPSVRQAKPVDARTLAELILAGPAEAAAGHSETADHLASIGSLSPDENRTLAYAIEGSGRVGIEYQSQSGGLTTRVIARPELFGDSIIAWCELRDAERWFRVERIQAVFPVG